MNQFDSLANKVFAVTTSVMGYNCAWLPSSGLLEEPLVAKIHFKDPAREVETSELGSGINQLGFMPEYPFIEYLEGAFDGLKDSVDQTFDEYLTITQFTTGDLVGYFKVREVYQIHDGRTYIAFMNKVESIPTPSP